MENDFLIIDGTSLAKRAFWGIEDPMASPSGQPMNAVFGFWTTVERVLAAVPHRRVLVAFDCGEPFRRKIYRGYKARGSGLAPALRKQIFLLPELSFAMGWSPLIRNGLEAGDHIASACRLLEGRSVVIVSHERYLYSLIGESTRVFAKAGAEWDYVTDQDVLDAFGVQAPLVSEVRALVGDKCGIPGVAGMGVKTAAKLVNRYGSAQRVFEQAAEQPPALRRNLELHRSGFEISSQLVALRSDVQIAPHILRATPQVKASQVLSFFSVHGLTRLSRRFSAKYGGIQPRAQCAVRTNTIAPFPRSEQSTTFSLAND